MIDKLKGQRPKQNYEKSTIATDVTITDYKKNILEYYNEKMSDIKY